MKSGALGKVGAAAPSTLGRSSASRGAGVHSELGRSNKRRVQQSGPTSEGASASM